MATNDARIEIRLPKSEKRAILAAAERAGQLPSVWMRWTLKAALETAPSEANGTGLLQQSGRVPVPSSANVEGVRPAAQSRTQARPRRADVGPKPASASRPRPKSKAKGGET